MIEALFFPTLLFNTPVEQIINTSIGRYFILKTALFLPTGAITRDSVLIVLIYFVFKFKCFTFTISNFSYVSYKILMTSTTGLLRFVKFCEVYDKN